MSLMSTCGLLTIPAQVPSIHDPTGARGVLHVEYPLVVRLGPGRPPRMVQRRFRDFDKLERALARHAGLGGLAVLGRCLRAGSARAEVYCSFLAPGRALTQSRFSLS